LARIVLWLTGLAALVGALGAGWNALGDRRDARRFPMPGRLALVPGGRRHLHCTGTGSPTVVLESGLGNPALSWALVQPEVAQQTRVCSYDRGGYGYSDPIGAGPRTAKQLALELHLLLERGRERGPYVLVGHSFGGLVARVFAARFPADVAGVVLVDASHEDAHARLPHQRPPEHLSRRLRTSRNLASLGVLRLRPALAGWDPASDQFRRLPPETLQALTWLALRSRTLEAATAEAEGFEQSSAQVRKAGPLGDRPLVVLVAARREPDLAYLPADSRATYWRIWVEELQPGLARLSTRGTLRVLPDSGHSIHLERPDEVIKAIEDVLAQVRAGAATSQAASAAPRR
ncbi:MAG: alpha/beta hydrolase, partial [Deltaproteobacteria bacterium]|nr:alpha/beta hydrolase [Deltaproteobacteria bacterium]